MQVFVVPFSHFFLFSSIRDKIAKTGDGGSDDKNKRKEVMFLGMFYMYLHVPQNLNFHIIFRCDFEKKNLISQLPSAPKIRLGKSGDVFKLEIQAFELKIKLFSGI